VSHLVKTISKIIGRRAHVAYFPWWFPIKPGLEKKKKVCQETTPCNLDNSCRSKLEIIHDRTYLMFGTRVCYVVTCCLPLRPSCCCRRRRKGWQTKTLPRHVRSERNETQGIYIYMQPNVCIWPHCHHRSNRDKIKGAPTLSSEKRGPPTHVFV
jgi:hypothetical protein